MTKNWGLGGNELLIIMNETKCKELIKEHLPWQA